MFFTSRKAKAVNREIERRRKLWKELEFVAQVAFNAVNEEAKRRGVDSWCTAIVPVTLVLRDVWYQLEITPEGELFMEHQMLPSDNELPDLTWYAPRRLTRAAVEALMARLKSCTKTSTDEDGQQ